jgi:hypothetical protein
MRFGGGHRQFGTVAGGVPSPSPDHSAGACRTPPATVLNCLSPTHGVGSRCATPPKRAGFGNCGPRYPVLRCRGAVPQALLSWRNLAPPFPLFAAGWYHGWHHEPGVPRGGVWAVRPKFNRPSSTSRAYAPISRSYGGAAQRAGSPLAHARFRKTTASKGVKGRPGCDKASRTARQLE